MSATIKITPSPGATEYRVTYGPTDPPAEGSTVIPVGSMIPMDDKLVADVPGIQPGHFVAVEAGNAYGYSAPIQGQALIAVAITSPEEAAVLKEEETVVIQGTSTGGLVDLEFTIDNEIWLPIAEDVDASTGTFSYEWTAVPLVIAIRAKTEGVADTVSVTTVPQSSPVIAFVSVPDATVGQDYTVEVSITDADGDLIPPLAADATLNDVAADSVSNVGDVYSFTWLAASLPVEGTGYVLAVVADDEGNRHASESTTVDVVAPAPAPTAIHRWTFDELASSGVTFVDSAGGLNLVHSGADIPVDITVEGDKGIANKTYKTPTIAAAGPPLTPGDSSWTVRAKIRVGDTLPESYIVMITCRNGNTGWFLHRKVGEVAFTFYDGSTYKLNTQSLASAVTAVEDIYATYDVSGGNVTTTLYVNGALIRQVQFTSQVQMDGASNLLLNLYRGTDHLQVGGGILHLEILPGVVTPF